ncbi:ABC transporter permease [Kineosporia succinea]|uniref:Simple sugar transport system permease protein n=1 Tax=Kineosporia succinea TaxID=84632 RepID=A0ABT9P4K5_9ACTN|nr:ABC transporter permease [Kineosporia succinea]MDP9827339.1 simple sugar transport system permease protein [Kineosporia succinea]
MKLNMDTVRRVGLSLAAPLLAIVLSLIITSVVLSISGNDPFSTFQKMIEYAQEPRTTALIINSAVTYYFAALAVSFGFRMNLFNIGVDGQYRLAALLAAAVGGAVELPAVLHVGLILVVAMLVGGLWAAVAGLLKVYRGISEVISTIMLNSITTALIAYLLTTDKLAVQAEGSNNIGTKEIAPSGRVGGLPLVPDSQLKIYGLIVLAAIVGFLYWFVIERSRFGFDLRATGRNEEAAVASGVNVKRMVLISMAISGGIAGLVGMPQLLGSSYTYSLDFPTGLGFTGIAIALLGRNTALGVAIGSLLWGFLDNSSQILDLEGVPKEIVMITQGVIVLSVVIAYELVRRYRLVAQQREVGRRLSEARPENEPQGAQA